MFITNISPDKCCYGLCWLKSFPANISPPSPAIFPHFKSKSNLQPAAVVTLACIFHPDLLAAALCTRPFHNTPGIVGHIEVLALLFKAQRTRGQNVCDEEAMPPSFVTK